MSAEYPKRLEGAINEDPYEGDRLDFPVKVEVELWQSNLYVNLIVLGKEVGGIKVEVATPENVGKGGPHTTVRALIWDFKGINDDPKILNLFDLKTDPRKEG